MKMAKHIWNKKTVIGFLLFYLFIFLPASAQIGSWRNYLSYHDVQQIQAAGDDLFVMASNGLYQYNKLDQSIYTYDKTKGLSDTYFTHIAWCQKAKRLVAIYGNSNIDLVETNNQVINVSDIYNKSIVGDKSIYGVYIKDEYAYLACGFGIVKLNVKEVEVSESYMLGFVVNGIVIEGNDIFAKSEEGTVWKGSLSSNLIDPNNWKQTETFPSFEVDMTDYNQYIELVSTLDPGGPKNNYCGSASFINNRLYTCNGFVNEDPASIQYLENDKWTVFQEDGIVEATGLPYQNIICLDVDPYDAEHVMAGSKRGLYEFRNGQFVNFYNSNNSPIEAYNGRSFNNQLVTGVKYESNGDLWILNSSAPTSSLIRYSNGEFKKFNHPELMKLNSSGFVNKSNGNMGKMTFDSEGILWFVNDNWVLPALYQYHTDQDKIIAYESIVNQDGTIISSALSNSYSWKCVVEDLNHDMWIGTDCGPYVFERDEIHNGGTTFKQIKVPRNDGTSYADYLLGGVAISAIVIDGGGRKWFGTKNNGIYLISSDNLTQLEHFTTDNSALLSNEIISLAINNTTGELFIGTDKGLCSYFTDATTAYDEMTKDNVWAYPNPVNPEYTGVITVVGLTYDADVKIVAANGALVSEGRSNGGTFVWNGCDSNGNRVASGVYMVVTATSSGQKGTVCRIAIVR